MKVQLRTGRKVGRTLYLQLSEEPADSDLLVGLVDTPALAKLIADAVNRAEVDVGLVQLIGPRGKRADDP